jgi:hypothetical protein
MRAGISPGAGLSPGAGQEEGKCARNYVPFIWGETQANVLVAHARACVAKGPAASVAADDVQSLSLPRASVSQVHRTLSATSRALRDAASRAACGQKRECRVGGSPVACVMVER